MLKALKTRAEIDKFNTMEYDVKLYQVKTSVVKCTKVRIKVLKFKRSYKNM